MLTLSLSAPRARAVERLLVSFLLVGLLMATCAPAQEPARPIPDSSTLPPPAVSQDVTRSNQLFGEIMSPFCPGLTLANCPSVYAETLRTSVRTRLEAGESPDTIVASLVAAFGEGVRATPRPRGIGVLLWVLPFVLLLAGGWGLGWWLRRRGRAGGAVIERTAAAPVAAISDADREKLAAALRGYD